MSSPTLHSTVGQLVVERPARSRVFQHLGIDFCCGGKMSLEQAARRKNLDPQTVLAMLLATEQTAGAADSADPAELGLSELCDDIEERHHAYLKAELPRLQEMLRKVARVHGDRYPWMRQVVEVFEPFSAEMLQHMAKEEEVLFPLIRRLEAGESAASGPGKVRSSIQVMEHEHDSAGAALARMRELTGDYEPPMDACNTFRASLDGLAELERDTHQHVHKENNVLFPRALEREVALQPPARG
jgi:regulator of cell morphogenesis and NO signaling